MVRGNYICGYCGINVNRVFNIYCIREIHLFTLYLPLIKLYITMKTYKVYSIVLFTILILVSCKQEIVNQESYPKVIEKSSITNDVVRDVALQLSKNITTRVNIDGDAELEEKYQEILTPFICDGMLMKEELYAQLKSPNPRYSLSEEEIEWLQYMREEDFATMSYILYAIETEEMKYGQVGKCFIGAALGIESIGTITNLRGLFRAKTALQIFKAIGRRYFFGYFALAYAVYDFAVCMELLHPNETI